MAIFNKDMVELARQNELRQKEVYRDPKVADRADEVASEILRGVQITAGAAII